MIVNDYEDIKKLETEEFINSLPDFEYGLGKIPPLESYLKLSCVNDAERMALAKMGALIAEQVVPGQKLYFNQALLLGAAFSKNQKYRSIMFIGNTRYGKLLANSTPVLTTEGWKTHGELHTGDYVFSPSGEPVMVVAESDQKQCQYRVLFNNGEQIDCHGDHEWLIYDDKDPNGIVVETKAIFNMLLPTTEKEIYVDKTNGIRIILVKKMNSLEYGKCIQVASKDGLYLAGKKLVPTHNSYLTGLIGIAMAALLKKEVRIGGATRDKADIVMEKIIGFMPKTSKFIQDGMLIGDSDSDTNKKIARLSTQTSREALAWKDGGSIKMFTMSETSKNRDVAGAGAIGVGGDVQIYDEAELISNANYYTARRFLSESSGTKLIELANPMTLGHLKDVYDNDTTFVLHFCDVTSILEQRMSRNDFDLTLIPKHTPEYRGFIQALFPPPEQGDGFFSTMPKSSYETPKLTYTKTSFMGIDSAYKGADGLVVTVVSLCRSTDGEKAWVQLDYQEDLKKRHPRWNDETTMQVALDILTLANKYGVQSACIDIAFGIHVYEMVKRIEPDFDIEPVNFGSKPTESRKEVHYSATWAYNLRAEMHLDVKEFCESELLYIDKQYFDDLIREMREIRVENEMGKIKVENKGKIKARLGSSPDHLDSLCLGVRAMVMSGFLGGTLGDDDIAYIEG